MSDERQMPLEKPAEPVVDMAAAHFAAETICEVASPKWREGTFQFDAVVVARAFLHLRAEVEALREGRDYWIKQCKNQLARVEEQYARAEASPASRTALLRDLRAYGKHKIGCASGAYAQRLAAKYCDCGLQRAIDAALAPPAQDASEKETG